MKNSSLQKFFSTNKSIKIPVTILLLVMGVYALLHYFVFVEDPVILLAGRVFDSYQLFIEKLANLYLKLEGSGISINHHFVFFNGLQFEAIENGMLLKKWTAVMLLLFWLTPSPLRGKILYSAFLFVFLLVFLPLGFAFNAYYNVFGEELMAPFRIGMTFPLLVLVSFLFLWLRKNWGVFRTTLVKAPAILRLIEKRRIQIVVIVYLFVVLKTYLTGMFDFEGWVSLIFRISAACLQALGYNAQTVPFYLYGDKVLIFMNKSCLGFGMMAIFAALVYLTGEKKRTKWLYIVSGILILNLVNILRFILLYIYLFKHGKYLLSIDIHDIYTGAIYIIVFLMWILWFEKYSDLKT